MTRVLLAYSGGVDSTFLLKTAGEVLVSNVLAVTAASPIFPNREYDRACEMAEFLGIRHISIDIDVLNDPHFYRNPPDRCYHCKCILFRKLREIADNEGISSIVDGSNLDDCSDYRPGIRAAKDARVRSPLVEAQLTKQEIRTLSKEVNLPTWDIPSMTCLASRFPYGEIVTVEKISRVDDAENFLRDAGFEQIRVRSHGRLARVEVDAARVDAILRSGMREKVVEELKRLGFGYVTIDLEGYREGSMNEVLPEEEKMREVENRSEKVRQRNVDQPGGWEI
jgi:uncharacterized protein